MSANIVSMFSVREVPWHREGHILEDYPTIPEAMVASGLHWTTHLYPLYTRSPLGHDLEVPGKFAVVRSDTRAVIGVVGSDYTPIQNVEAFDVLAPAVGAGRLRLETAGELSGGGRVWVLASSGDPVEVVPGDPVSPYLLLTHSHDGSTAFTAKPTAVRVVCQNTLSVALQGKERATKIRHTSGAPRRLAQLSDAISASGAAFGQTLESWRHMASRQINPETYAEAVVREHTKRPAGDLPSRGTNLISDILEAYDRAPGAQKARGSAWAAYNAVTYHIDHVRGANTKTDEQRTDSMWFGSGDRMRETAYKIAVNMADGSTEYLTGSQAAATGVDPRQLGRSLLADLMAD